VSNCNIFIKSPLNYIGGKYKLLNQILPLFPNNINTFMEVFVGGCNVGINVQANNFILNDNLLYIIDLYKEFKNKDYRYILNHINSRIQLYQLSKENDQGYKLLREQYNTERDSLDLFVLIAYSFNHQIRFNNSYMFNTPFGRNRSSFNDKMEANLLHFIDRIQKLNITFLDKSFDEIDYSFLGLNDFVYCDPPYLISTGTYNDGKRGFTGWGETEEKSLLKILDSLHSKGIRFALSNVLEHKGKENIILKNWIDKNNYFIHNLTSNYNNSNYQIKNKNNDTKEVLITNYLSK
jgi:DNA adenine methylase